MQTEIENYEEAAAGQLLSVFELQVSLQSRDYLHTASLSPEERQQVNQLDQEYLSRAVEVSGLIAEYGDADSIFAEKPPQRWWWHIARIASGQMSVDLAQKTVVYEGQKYKF
ncbi:hypothetical protein MKY48_08635 [Paenibacillus sp. FSL W8-0187]|uniref:hypothetical protein n=1 Tax=Paenibacillus sp. FSL W8-0187 TaxID=2921710 RepID=UPI0030DB8EE6